MRGTARAALVASLRAATAFGVSGELVAWCLTASAELVRKPALLAALEADLRGLLLDGKPLPPERRAAARPVLGNIAEAVVETILVEAGWSPLDHDSQGMSFGHGVDLLMLDATAERVVAVEVKSTIQSHRWPRLTRGSAEQLTPVWLDGGENVGMRDLGFDSADVFVMVAQLHFTRLQWRACVGSIALTAVPIITEEQLQDLSWVPS